MRRALAIFLCATTGLAGCATSGRMASATPAPAEAGFDRAVMADYIRRLPIGSRLRIDLADGHVLHARLMKVEADWVVVQRRTRVPEPPQQIAIADLRAVDIEQGGNAGRTIGIAIAAGAGATLGVLLLLAAIFSD